MKSGEGGAMYVYSRVNSCFGGVGRLGANGGLRILLCQPFAMCWRERCYIYTVFLGLGFSRTVAARIDFAGREF